MEIVNTYNITFTVRNYHSINETMRIIWKGKYYRIISILPDKYKQSTDIIGELINE
ncbi:Phage head-tail joining protein [Macellibacteroides fermentans]|uniref:Phage head-tail joining protein n=2 Tax=Bacteroidales TaxID=171549 RepID=A0A1T5B8F9_9BACT|nr:Phage head-tail joining protein [Parabacteroides chartae]